MIMWFRFSTFFVIGFLFLIDLVDHCHTKCLFRLNFAYNRFCSYPAIVMSLKRLNSFDFFCRLYSHFTTLVIQQWFFMELWCLVSFWPFSYVLVKVALVWFIAPKLSSLSRSCDLSYLDFAVGNLSSTGKVTGTSFVIIMIWLLTVCDFSYRHILWLLVLGYMGYISYHT